MQNGYIESFNGKFRDEHLNESWFQTLHQARKRLLEWKLHFRTTPKLCRPQHHISVGKDRPHLCTQETKPSAPHNRDIHIRPNYRPSLLQAKGPPYQDRSLFFRIELYFLG